MPPRPCGRFHAASTEAVQASRLVERPDLARLGVWRAGDVVLRTLVTNGSGLCSLGLRTRREPLDSDGGDLLVPCRLAVMA